MYFDQFAFSKATTNRCLNAKLGIRSRWTVDFRSRWNKAKTIIIIPLRLASLIIGKVLYYDDERCVPEMARIVRILNIYKKFDLKQKECKHY
jgi:hypothetical protein